jgi:hypothetical protein
MPKTSHQIPTLQNLTPNAKPKPSGGRLCPVVTISAKDLAEYLQQHVIIDSHSGTLDDYWNNDDRSNGFALKDYEDKVVCLVNFL